MLRVLVVCCVIYVLKECDAYQNVYGGPHVMRQPTCDQMYYTTLTNNGVPPRTYKYFDEAKDESEDLEWRIIGGVQIDIRMAPYAVLYGLYCGGTIIAPQWVITAAHCKSKDTFVIAGSTRASTGQHYSICKHFVHPKYDQPNKSHHHDYDYQLLLLDQALPVTPQTRPIAIGALSSIAPGAMVTISGWGHVTVKDRQMQDILQQVTVPVISQEACRHMDSPYYNNITSRMFCAGLDIGTKDACQVDVVRFACQSVASIRELCGPIGHPFYALHGLLSGDSGGAAIIANKLVGLVSFGVGCAEIRKPGVYGKIPAARNWIRDVTGLPL